MKKLTLLIMIAIAFNESYGQNYKTLYDFSATTIDGNLFDFKTLKGEKVLIVNTASRCGFTPQYKELQALYEKYGSDSFTIIGFPANDFLHQEPGTNEEIADFCEKNYGVKFQMMAKISVKGKKMHPLYQWLTKKSENGVMDAAVKWNFQKFMIDGNGRLVGMALPSEKPDSERIINWITGK